MKTQLWKQIVIGAGVGILLLGPTGCMVLHHVFPQAQRPAAEEFGMGPRRSAGGTYLATLETDRPLVKGKLQVVRLALTDSEGRRVDGATLGVDGGMPEHGHGLPTQPRITRALGDGRYLVEGVKFNMGGDWTLRVEVVGPSGADVAVFPIGVRQQLAYQRSGPLAVSRTQARRSAPRSMRSCAGVSWKMSVPPRASSTSVRSRKRA